MKNALVLIMLLLPLFLFSQKWQSAELLMIDGSLIQGEVRLRDNVGFRELKFRSASEAKWIDLSNIKSGQINQKEFSILHLTEEEGEPYALGWKLLKENWYFSLFKERECLCNNSYKHSKAYIVLSQGRYVVLRKKAFKDALKEPELLKNIFPEISDTNLRFSEIPALISKSSSD